MNANMQLTINSFKQLFPQKIFSDISLIFIKILDISLTAVKFPDISRFSRQVVTLNIRYLVYGAVFKDPRKINQYECKYCTTQQKKMLNRNS